MACQANSPVRNVKMLDITRINDYVMFEIEANAFLHHMVRYLVGTMIAGSQDRIELDYFEKLINNPEKNVKIFKAPPQGLILTGIDYEI